MTRRMTTAMAIGIAVTLALAAGAAFAASSARSGAARYSGDVLRVGLYGGSWEDGVKQTAGAAFQSATGATVQYTEGNPSDIAAQIMAAAAQGTAPPVDVIETDTQTQTLLAQRGLLVPVSAYRSQVPGIFSNVKEPPANVGYAPPHCDWYIVFAYNTQKYQAQGIKPPVSWNALFDPKLAGHVSIPDISTAMGIPTMMAVGGGDQPAQLERGIARLSKLKTYSVYTSSSAMQTDIANGNIWAASATDGRAWQLQEKGLPIRVIYPQIVGSKKHGPMAGSCFLDIVKGSTNVGLAAQFIKASYSDRAQVDFAKLTNYRPSSNTALALLQQERPYWRKRLPKPSSVLSVRWSVVIPHIQSYIDQFNRAFGH